MAKFCYKIENREKSTSSHRSESLYIIIVKNHTSPSSQNSNFGCIGNQFPVQVSLSKRRGNIAVIYPNDIFVQSNKNIIILYFTFFLPFFGLSASSNITVPLL